VLCGFVRKRLSPSVPGLIIQDGGAWPRRLESPSSVTVYFPFNYPQFPSPRSCRWTMEGGAIFEAFSSAESMRYTRWQDDTASSSPFAVWSSHPRSCMPLGGRRTVDGRRTQPQPLPRSADSKASVSAGAATGGTYRRANSQCVSGLGEHQGRLPPVVESASNGRRYSRWPFSGDRRRARQSGWIDPSLT